ncbi:MAG: SDR family oxidoreductase [Verrucomicrobiaceae bacterium]|nr:MAG: SDR family oxidoreductase [Verrucomicrobiaceae bacterium]
MNSPRVIAITGSSRGAGLGFARHFAESKGWIVHGCSRGQSEYSHPNYTHTVADMGVDADARRWVRTVKQAAGRVDVLLCNAGVVKSALMTPVLPTDLFMSFFESSFKATFVICREMSKLMIGQRFGSIVTIGSSMTIVHEPGTAAYSANKAAVAEFTKVLARELAPHGVTCNVLAPSLIQTLSSDAMGEDWRKRILALQTIQRPVDVSELAAVVEFFAADTSKCITGQVITTCFVAP